MPSRSNVSLGTISNAANKKTDLCATYLKRLGERYGCTPSIPTRRSFGGRLVPINGEAAADLSLPCIVTRFMLELSVALEDGRIDHVELARMRPHVEALTTALDGLRERMKPRAVGEGR